MENLIKQPVLGLLSQGSIFSCAVAEDYASSQVFGMIITARCDIVQSKASMYHYVPVVTLDEWIHREGRVIACERLLKDTKNSMKNSLKSAGHSEGILQTADPSAILDKIFVYTPGDRGASQRHEKFSDLVEQYKAIEACATSNPEDRALLSLGGKRGAICASLIKELIEQKLSGFYFLPRIEYNGSDLGHVALLREPRHIPRSLVERVAQGMSAAEYKAACDKHGTFNGHLSFASDDFAMPVGTLISPHIEHIMQTFSMLFSRIGLPDPKPEYIADIWSRQPSVKGSL